MSSDEAQNFVDTMRELIATDSETSCGGVEYVAGQALGERVAVLLYREYVGGPVLGRRFNLDDMRRDFKPITDPKELAHTMFINEVLDPTGRGQVLNVDWADGLGIDRRDIEWVGQES